MQQRTTASPWRRILLLTALALLASAAALAWSQPVHAADFTVTKTADTADGTCDADCSLREAINAANAAAGADTITLPAGTYTLSIAGINEDFGQTGDLDISDDLTINGAGEGTTILDGGAIDRVLQVLGGTVVINDVTIQNGDAFDLGGGIRSAGTLTVNGSTITGNNAWGGGGIYNSNADYSIATSDQSGGPTYSFVDISGTGTALGLGSSGSSAETTGFDFTFYGESYDTVYVSNKGYLTFLDNNKTDGSNRQMPTNEYVISAIFGFWDNLDQGSGDIYVETQGTTPNQMFIVQYDDVAIDGSPLTFQIILFETSNQILLQYLDVETNTRTQGDDATVGIIDSEERTSGIGYLYEQPLLTDGLAILFTPLSATGLLTLDDVTLSRNNAVETEGGGLFNNGTATVQNGTLVTENTTESNGEGNGAGLANRNGTLTVLNSTVFSNTNASYGNGAGISNFYGTATIEDTTVEDNFMPDEDGSGVGLANGFGTMIVTSSVITGNNSESTFNISGGGIFNLFGKVSISDTVIANNTLLEGNSGAGIQSIHGIVEITNSSVTTNTVGDSSSGAGIDAIKSRLIIDGSTVADNLNPSTFEDNINSDGGGIRINQGELVVTNSTVSGNETTSGDGGGIAHISGGARPIAYTMFDNRFYDDGPTFNFIDISGTGTALNLGDDDSSQQAIGFDFTFYDTIESQVYVSSNGYLTFENVDTTSTSTECSEDGVKTSIYGFWADLDPGAGGQIYVATGGSAPNRQFIVQYDDVPFNADATTVTFQIILFEGTNRILFQYQDVENVGELMDDEDVVIGLDSPQRGDYDSYQAMRHYLTCGYEGILPENGLAIELTPAGGLTVANSTISGNTAGNEGGGIYYDGVITGGAASLINATVAFNDAPTGAGIRSTVSDTLVLTNTIVTTNTTGADCAGMVTSGGSNLDGDGSCNLVAAGDIPNGDARLGPLADNGGETLTHLLLAMSDAIDAGLDAACAALPVDGRDQRGILRPVGAFCDMGAVEVSVPEMAVLGNGTQIASGDATPDPADGTDFGSADMDGETIANTFTISNSGQADLMLTGSPSVALSDETHFAVGTQPASTTLAPDGTTTFAITFDPALAGTITATVMISNTDSDEHPYTFVVGGEGTSNSAPVAANDGYTTNEDAPLSVSAPGVLNNDTDADTDPLTATLVSDVMTGTLDLDADGSFVYTPTLHFSGMDNFTYLASDGTLTDTATVTLTVNALNDEPVAAADSYSTTEDVPLLVATPGVLANDTDVENDGLTAKLVSDVMSGTLMLNMDGSFVYTPTLNFHGTDHFTYQANDGGADSNLVTVTLAVDADNDAPVALDDSYTTQEDSALTEPAPGVLENDSDVENDDLTATLIGDVTNGTLMLSADGSFVYTPTLNFNGIDTFTYVANDGELDSATQTVTITVGVENDAPVADDDSYSTDEDVELHISAPGVLDDDTDVENDPLTAHLVSDVSHGTLSLNSDGSFVYAPDANFNGSDSFTYQANDGDEDSNVSTVTIYVDAANDPPVATDDAYSTNEDTPLSVTAPGVLDNDTDVEHDPLSAHLVSGVSNGLLTFNADGSFVYTPTVDFHGSDSFTYQANDGIADSNATTVTITVDPVNDAPVAADDAYSTVEDTVLSESAPGVLDNDTDVENDALSAHLVGDVLSGTLSFNADGTFVYTPTADFNGAELFTYQASDGALDSELVTVTISVGAENDAPVADDDSYSTGEDVELQIGAPGVLDGDTDTENDALTANLVGGISNGALTLSSDGSFVYTPNANFHGSDSFTYQANDGTADSNVATVTITVGPENDAPVATHDAYSTNQDVPLNAAAPGVLGNDTDVENDALSASLVGDVSNGTLTLNRNGSFTYMPTLNFSGIDSFTYVANDGAADSAAATVVITVNADPVVPGSCNADAVVDIRDVFATVLEIFDGDGRSRTDTDGGSFAGRDSCDSNADNVVDAGDLSCTVRLIFNGSGACDLTDTGSPSEAPAQLAVADELPAEAGETVAIPVALHSQGHAVTAIAFALTYDRQAFVFDSTDADGDGVPDAIALNLAANQEAVVSRDAATGRVEIALLGSTPDAVPFADGTVATVTLTAFSNVANGVYPIALSDSSLGNDGGRSVDLTVSDGSVLIGEEGSTLENPLYLPLIEQ